ncbi:MAG: DUF1501 domain-containing protein [Lentisphaeraceae bacterium]|nr:DUF1501 domain-containing protein [Lentisphaeraceae bacterium]
MTSVSMLSSLLHLKMTNSVLAASRSSINTGGYKALVCIFLHGGNDSFNMLTPWTAGEHSEYSKVRGDVALQRAVDPSKPKSHQIKNGKVSFSGEVTPIGAFKENENKWEKPYGLHYAMPHTKELFHSQRLSFIANVGTLVKKGTSVEDFNRKRSLPRALFSHKEQQQSWQSSVPSQLRRDGWIGRIADIINDKASQNSNISMNVSLAGANLLQSGSRVSPFLMGSGGPLLPYDDNGHKDVKKVISQSLAENYSNVLHNHYNYTRKDSVDYNKFLSSKLNSKKSSLAGYFSSASQGNSLSRQLKQIALSIAARRELGANRQTFFVSLGGFDNHFNVIPNQAEVLSTLDTALFEFNEALNSLGSDGRNVVTYTASDFGRTLTPNNNGTDHGWGGNQIVMGAPIKGRRVFGKYPSLHNNSKTDAGRGRQIPTTSVDEVHASLANWYGVPNDNTMVQILPNIREFWRGGTTRNAPLPIIR